MIIAVPKEIKDQEYRVGLPPSGAYQLARRSHKVIVETNAGLGAGFPDSDYIAAGAIIVENHAAVLHLDPAGRRQGGVNQYLSGDG